MTLAATLAVFAATSNSTAAWLEHRAKLVDSVLGYGVGKLPTRSTPDWIVENVAPGGGKSPFAYANWWDLYNVSSFFHSLGYDVFIHSMPLKGVNVGPAAIRIRD